MSPSFDFTDWKHFDPLTKRRVSFLDNVSSCIPKSVYGEVPFRPLINAEDMDLGIRMLEKGKRLGFLSSTGVYHWHDRGPDYILKRHYIGTKANLYTMKNSLPRFFEVQDIGWRTFVANVADLLDLVMLALPEPGALDPGPVNAAAAFVSSFRRYFDASPEDVSAALGKAGGSCEDRLEAACPGVFGSVVLLPGERHRFRKNFLVPHFLSERRKIHRVPRRKAVVLPGQGKGVRGLHPQDPRFGGRRGGGVVLSRIGNPGDDLTEEQKRMDHLLAKGVCYF